MKFGNVFPLVRRAKKSLVKTIDESYSSRINLLNRNILQIKKFGFDKPPYNDMEYLKLVAKGGKLICPEGLIGEIPEAYKGFLSVETRFSYECSKKELARLLKQGMSKFA